MLFPPPVSEVSREALFRSLLPLRPSLPITFRFAAAPDARLRVRALTSAEVNQVHDEAQRLDEAGRASHVQLGFVAASLTDLAGRHIFAGPDDVGDLDVDEAQELARAVWRALGRIGPILGHFDNQAWHAALCEGARATANSWTTYALGQCYDASYSRVVDRPDRYWGVPLAELTGGHWLAYRAARALYEERMPKG